MNLFTDYLKQITSDEINEALSFIADHNLDAAYQLHVLELIKQYPILHEGAMQLSLCETSEQQEGIIPIIITILAIIKIAEQHDLKLVESN